jgi:hypothetical protein
MRGTEVRFEARSPSPEERENRPSLPLIAELSLSDWWTVAASTEPYLRREVIDLCFACSASSPRILSGFCSLRVSPCHTFWLIIMFDACSQLLQSRA